MGASSFSKSQIVRTYVMIFSFGVVAVLLLGGREERVDHAEHRAGADRVPEADQRETGQQPGNAGDGETVDQRAEERVEHDETEDAADGAREHVADEGGAGEQREEGEHRDEADDTDEQRRKQTSAETARERHQPEGGQNEHEQQNLDDESEHVCFSVFFDSRTAKLQSGCEPAQTSAQLHEQTIQVS